MVDPLALDRLRIDEAGRRRLAEASSRQGTAVPGVREARSHRAARAQRRTLLRPLLGR
jgi:hypothetical protein